MTAGATRCQALPLPSSASLDMPRASSPSGAFLVGTPALAAGPVRCLGWLLLVPPCPWPAPSASEQVLAPSCSRRRSSDPAFRILRGAASRVRRPASWRLTGYQSRQLSVPSVGAQAAASAARCWLTGCYFSLLVLLSPSEWETCMFLSALSVLSSLCLCLPVSLGLGANVSVSQSPKVFPEYPKFLLIT